MIRGIFFDLFGTLLVYGNMKKAWSDWLEHFHVSLSRHGLPLSRERFSKQCDRFFDTAEPAPTSSRLTVMEERIKSLCASLRLRVPDGEISEIADLLVGQWQREICLDLDAIPVLEELRRTRALALVSNFDHPRHVRKCLARYGLDVLFESIVISGEVGIKKPDPRVFQAALTDTGLGPGEVAYVGDTEEDVEAADAAGMVPILIRRPTGTEGRSQLDFEDDSSIKGEVDCVRKTIQCRTISTLSELLDE